MGLAIVRVRIEARNAGGYPFVEGPVRIRIMWHRLAIPSPAGRCAAREGKMYPVLKAARRKDCLCGCGRFHRLGDRFEPMR